MCVYVIFIICCQHWHNKLWIDGHSSPTA